MKKITIMKITLKSPTLLSIGELKVKLDPSKIKDLVVLAGLSLPLKPSMDTMLLKKDKPSNPLPNNWLIVLLEKEIKDVTVDGLHGL